MGQSKRRGDAKPVDDDLDEVPVDDDLDEVPVDEPLPIGNAWAPHLLDDEAATALACDRAFASYMRSSRERGHADRVTVLPLTEAQRAAFHKPVHPKLAAERCRARAEAEREAMANDKPAEERRPTARRTGHPKITTDAIVAVLRRRGPLERGRLQALVGAAQATFHRALRVALESGAIERRGRIGFGHIYAVVGGETS